MPERGRHGYDRVIYLALLKGMSYEVRTRRIMCVDVVNARRKLVEIRDRATGAYGRVHTSPSALLC